MARALAREAAGVAFEARAIEPLLLPVRGSRVYRALRGLLREAREVAGVIAVKLAVVDLLGKSHVEVMAVASTPTRARVLRRSFPRHAANSLAGGFREGCGWE